MGQAFLSLDSAKGAGFIAVAPVSDHRSLVVGWHYLLYFLVAVPGPNLIHYGLIGIEGHQVDILPTYPLAGVVSVHDWGIPYLSPQILVGSAHFVFGPTQGILSDRPLSQPQPSQSF